jgi:alpha-beta hydrolase superfamily lysophospholipase
MISSAAGLEASVARLETPEATLSYRLWLPPSPLAAAVHLHGIESHSGWYTELGKQLRSRGIAVYCMDRAGSGLSSGRRGDIQSWRCWVRHAQAMVGLAQAEHPGRKVYLIASCWGAKTGLQFALSHPEGADGLILISPALRMRIGFARLTTLRIAASSVLAPERQFAIPIGREEMFTGEPECVEFIRTDPLRLKSATARFLAETRKLDWQNGRRLRRLRMPALALLAGSDQIVDTPRVEALLRKTGAVEIRTLAGAHHSVEFAPTGETVAQAIRQWMETAAEIRQKAVSKTNQGE